MNDHAGIHDRALPWRVPRGPARRSPGATVAQAVEPRAPRAWCEIFQHWEATRATIPAGGAVVARPTPAAVRMSARMRTQRAPARGACWLAVLVASSLLALAIGGIYAVVHGSSKRIDLSAWDGR